jgi:PKD repeat protein
LNFTSPLNLTITSSTNKQSYYLRENVVINGTFLKDGSPASNALIIVEICDPRENAIIFRTLKIGNPTYTLPVNIKNLSITDTNYNPLSTIKVGTDIRIIITVENPQATSREVFITITLFDANMVPIFAGYSSATILPGKVISPIFSTSIPLWACSGKALLVGNVYNKEPKTMAIAYALEKRLNFYISKTNQGFISYMEDSNAQDSSQPGLYSFAFRLSPEPINGSYQTYIIGQIDPATASQTSTTFQVQQSEGYPPQASFAFWPSSPYVNQTVNFDASFSTAEGYNDTIIRYEWDFGDGTPKVVKEGNFTNPPDPTITHKFQTAQTYIVTLNVTDNEGLWSITSKPITILPEFGPTANFTWTPTTPFLNETVTFNASSSTLGWSAKRANFSPIVEYLWNFSDGTGNITITEPTIKHNFTQPGNYSVWLTVKDADGRSNSTCYIVQVLNMTLKIYDINRDGIIDMKDIYRVVLAYGATPESPRWDPACDTNNDGIVDMKDLYGVVLNYMKDP